MVRPPRAFAVALAINVAADAAAQQAPPAPPAAAVAASKSPLAERAARRADCHDTKVLAAIRDGLGWLRSHQDEDGGWDCDGFCKHDNRPKGADAGEAHHDVGVTALALLAMLAEADPLYDAPIQRGVDWLTRHQGTDGFMGTTSLDAVYDHAIATLVLVEGYDLLRLERWRAAAAAGLAHLDKRRSRGAAWRYGFADGDSDMSVTSWCIEALAAGVAAGFEVDATAVGEALGWVDGATDRFDCRTGYTRPREGSARRVGDIDRFPAYLGEAMTAAAIHVRLLLGIEPAQPLVEGGAAAVNGLPPHADDPKALDYYYWFHASQAMAQMPKPTAAKWAKALDAALPALQEHSGADAGSWAPADPWGQAGGRIYSTALAVLSLQARYRVAPAPLAQGLPRTGPLAPLRDKLLRGERLAAFELFAKLGRPGGAGADEFGGVLAPVRWSFAVECRALERELASHDAAKPEDKDWLAYADMLERARLLGRGAPLGADAERRLQELKKDAKAQREIDSGQRLRALREKLDAHRGDRSKLIEQVEKLADDFADTNAGKLARWLAAQLHSGGARK